MKKLGYWLFAYIFNICRIFPVKRQKVVLFNGHNHGLNGNLLEIRKEIIRREPETKFVFRSKRDMFAGRGVFGKVKGIFSFFFVLPYHMATSQRIFLNDNFLPLGYCIPSRRTQIVQLWHGAGAFKKFGLSIEDDEEVQAQVIKANSRITHLFVTSKKVIPFYQEAFCVPKERIYVTGISITDVYDREESAKEAKQRFYSKYPYLKDKKILLYTPTFRQSTEENVGIMKHFPIEQIHDKLGKEWVILVKLHPKYPVDNIVESDYCYNVTGYSQIIDLFFVSDVLITDYSSTIVEYVLLDKPIILYAFDLDRYDRGFYRDYESTVPGIVACNKDELLEAIMIDQKDSNKRRDFIRLQYDYRDGESSKRIMDVLNKTNQQGNED